MGNHKTLKTRSMEMNYEQLLSKVTDFIKTEATTETIVGEKFDLGEFSCVPVIKVAMGFGSGGGEGSDSNKAHGSGGGAGAGVKVDPIGFLVTNGPEISFISTGRSKGLAAAFEKVPDLIEKLATKKEAAEAEA
jgi:uncharacterized spore protein YtfJ